MGTGTQINPSGHSMYVFHIRSGECYVVVVVSMPMGVHELVPAVDAILDVLRPALDSTLRLWPSTTCLQSLLSVFLSQVGGTAWLS